MRILYSALLSLLLTVPAGAASLAGVTLPDKAEVKGQSLTLNGIARCIASVVKKLAPDGRFYATWLDNPDPQRFGTLVREDGAKSYSDRDPFHYSFAVLAALADAVGGRAERLDDTSHPRGEAVMVITRGSDS